MCIRDSNSGPRERTDTQAAAISAESVGVNLDAQAQGTNPEAARSDARPERNSRNGGRGYRRPPRGPKPADEAGLDVTGNPAADADVTPTAPAEPASIEADTTDTGNRSDTAPREKRSRDRYGRDRKGRGERSERVEAGSEASSFPQSQDGAAAVQEEDCLLYTSRCV